LTVFGTHPLNSLPPLLQRKWEDLHIAVRCLKEVVRILLTMITSSNPKSSEISKSLQHNVYYEGQILSIIPELLKNYHRQNKTFLADLVELAHLFMKMYEAFSSEKEYIIIQKKARKVKAKTPKPKVEGEEQEEEPEEEEGAQDAEHNDGETGEAETGKGRKRPKMKPVKEDPTKTKSVREERLDFKIFQLVTISFLLFSFFLSY